MDFREWIDQVRLSIETIGADVPVIGGGVLMQAYLSGVAPQDMAQRIVTAVRAQEKREQVTFQHIGPLVYWSRDEVKDTTITEAAVSVTLN